MQKKIRTLQCLYMKMEWYEIYNDKYMGHLTVTRSDLKLVEVQLEKNITDALLAEFLYNDRKKFQRCSKRKNLACSIST
jgi:hypothetical protein